MRADSLRESSSSSSSVANIFCASKPRVSRKGSSVVLSSIALESAWAFKKASISPLYELGSNLS